MNKLLTKLTMIKDPTPLQTAMNTNQGLMGLSGMKQLCHIQGFKIPSMNCTHYVRFFGDSRGVLEWLMGCNFLPLMYTGIQPDMKKLQDYNYYLDNVGDILDNETGRYSFKLGYATDYERMIPAGVILPHMVLDFRGLQQLAFGHHNEVQEFITGVCNYVAGVQDSLTEINHPDYERSTWDIEHDHNPMITVMSDWTGSFAPSPLLAKYKQIHTFVGTDVFDGALEQNTFAGTYVREYTKKELAKFSNNGANHE